MNQLDFLSCAISPQLARRRDPVTSQQAAARTVEFKQSHADKILWCLRAHGPQTVDELAKRLSLNAQQINKRLPEMSCEPAVVIPTGQTRMSASGRAERVWKAL